jgi:hypothetical protein
MRTCMHARSALKHCVCTLRCKWDPSTSHSPLALRMSLHLLFCPCNTPYLAQISQLYADYETSAYIPCIIRVLTSKHLHMQCYSLLRTNNSVRMLTMRTGLGCNLGDKTGGFGKPWDENLPYKVNGICIYLSQSLFLSLCFFSFSHSPLVRL